ncbi:MAG: acyltransferase family protein [Oscillospiraceae bacterium]|nr:acyltransferase family protein [Oscillospiraceae bacterium]
MEKRDSKFDTLRGLLILLVVFGHLLEKQSFYLPEKSPLLEGIYTCIYCFHMPAMVLLSGYFSKGLANRPEALRKAIGSYLIPYVVMNALICLLINHNPNQMFYPQFSMWYLLSLFFWRLLLPGALCFRLPLLLWVGLALLTGTTKTAQFLSASRTICFFPLFLAGYYLQAEQVRRLRRLPKLLPAILLALLLALAFCLYRRGIPTGIYYMKGPYSKLKLSPTQGILLRGLALGMGFAATLCLIALMPERKTFLTGLGARTMPVYLLQAPLILFLSKQQLLRLDSPALGLGFAAGLCGAICLLAGNPLVGRGYRRLSEWVGNLLLKPAPRPQGVPQNHVIHAESESSENNL